MTEWNAHYKDELHDLDIVIVNEEADKFDNLSFTIDGFTFTGGSFTAFELKDPAQFELAKDRFRLMKSGGKMTGIDHVFPYVFDLQRYALDVRIPLCAERGDGSLTGGILHISYRYEPHDMCKFQSRIYCDDQRVWRDDLVVTDFRFTADGRDFPVFSDSLWLDTDLSTLCCSIAPDYQLRCCYTCQWSDYSPYGSDDFGTMLCFKAHQEEYLKVNTKDDFFELLEGLPFEQRQETYLCPDFAHLVRCEGYRGFV